MIKRAKLNKEKKIYNKQIVIKKTKLYKGAIKREKMIITSLKNKKKKLSMKKL